MESRFVFLEDICPKLAEHGRKAEESFSTDPNICLLNLGRIAELITETLRRQYNIPDSPEKLTALTEKGAITDDIARKISALTETKNEAADDGYDSGMACEKLIVTAEELCRWFVAEKAEGRFAFLADIFTPGRPVPVLMNLSELGREAEENLFTNTRYCLICLGDMGEAVADRLITDNAIETHERDQIDRIDVLADNAKIPDSIKDILHSLRMARNKALHERYNDEYTSESEGVRLIDDALTLCEWVFMATVKPGYVVKARITGESDGGYSAATGRISAIVPAGEVPEGRVVEAGKKYVFKVMDSDADTLRLSMSLADNDYDLSVARLYAKYKPGQDVHVTIKTLSNSTGAIVELKDGLEARIPPSELGRRIYRYDNGEKLVKYETTARVKWFSLTQYPPMLLSVKDVEDDDGKNQPPAPAPKAAMSDMDFRLFCKSAPYEKIIQALDEGANPNATNNNNTTALMMAAQYNKNARVVKALIDEGARVNEQNHKGNTALMYAAMSNTADVVRAIIDAGADIGLINSDGKKAVDYAKGNRKLNGTDIVSLLRDEPEAVTEIETVTEAEPVPEVETVPEIIVVTEDETIPESQPEQEPTPEPETITEAVAVTESEPIAEHDTNTETESVPEADTVPESQSEQEPTPGPEQLPESATLPEPEHVQESESALPPAHLPPDTEPAPTPEPVPAHQEFHHVQQESDDENTYYEYELDEQDSIPTKEEEEAMRQMKQKLQRDFLKICRSGSEDEIAEAVSAGVNVNVTNKSSATALMFAAKSNTAEAVEILIHAGATIDAQDASGNTALIYAATYNSDDVIDILVKAGADINITNMAGHTARDYAAKNYRLIDTEALSKL